jgi:RNase H-fold protein (predicted Holliday junction resolvase)
LSRGKSVVYLGIDPGTSNTGLAVIRKTPSGSIKVLHLETIRTSPKQSNKERFDIILNKITGCVETYGVQRVICEAFEVRTWQKPMKKCVIMSKLVNAISEHVYGLRLPFMLSSPDTKRLFSVEDMEEVIKMPVRDLKVPYFTHAQDALRHVLYQVKVGGK